MFPTSPLCMLVLSLFPIFWVEWRVPSAQAVAFVVHQFFPRCRPGFSWSASSGALLLAEPLCIQLRDLKRSGRRAVRVQDRTYSCTEPSVSAAPAAPSAALWRGLSAEVTWMCRRRLRHPQEEGLAFEELITGVHCSLLPGGHFCSFSLECTGILPWLSLYSQCSWFLRIGIWQGNEFTPVTILFCIEDLL